MNVVTMDHVNVVFASAVMDIVAIFVIVKTTLFVLLMHLVLNVLGMDIANVMQHAPVIKVGLVQVVT